MELAEREKMKEHKKRMIVNQRKRKQEGLDNILLTIKNKLPEFSNKISPKSSFEDASVNHFSSLYRPIPPLGYLLMEENTSKLHTNCDIKELLGKLKVEEGVHETPISTSNFWSDIPPMCTPDHAKLDSNIASDKLLKGEAARQKKYLKKLEMKLKCGDITEEEKEQMMTKFGRENLKEGKGETEEVDSFSLLNSSRGLRKRQQVENIASLFKIFGERKVVVDFGSGSGNLCLALASYYKNSIFIFADQNVKSLELLSNRARDGGLTNVRVKSFSFNSDNLEDFISELKEELGDRSSFDLGIGLHCCGRFTDLVMEVCRLARADCVVVPCCNGKIGKDYHKLVDNEDIKEEGLEKEIVTELQFYPRSDFISSHISRAEYFQLSRAADDENNYEAKCAIEFDRARWAQENGFAVSLLRMMPLSATPKHHVLYCTFLRK
eukprot:GFUD01018144.1.p1 GENE.GFUD01018144.1~~GFUD01018144.1.p1  ORF type:complete len:456 (+),score=139.56 GFUD01018144.1:58-1368(+)